MMQRTRSPGHPRRNSVEDDTDDTALRAMHAFSRAASGPTSPWGTERPGRPHTSPSPRRHNEQARNRESSVDSHDSGEDDESDHEARVHRRPPTPPVRRGSSGAALTATSRGRPPTPPASTPQLNDAVDHESRLYGGSPRPQAGFGRSPPPPRRRRHSSGAALAAVQQGHSNWSDDEFSQDRSHRTLSAQRMKDWADTLDWCKATARDGGHRVFRKSPHVSREPSFDDALGEGQ
ncbi:hypothetical protein T484DRAFT_2020095 [Baffinella frigidus]|nr:hypothetical protein T484DRAFT_2020095 [Cryptophyta sp. CCMP2293]